MDFWTYPTLYTTLRDKLPPEVHDLATFHSSAMAEWWLRVTPSVPNRSMRHR